MALGVARHHEKGRGDAGVAEDVQNRRRSRARTIVEGECASPSRSRAGEAPANPPPQVEPRYYATGEGRCSAEDGGEHQYE